MWEECLKGNVGKLMVWKIEKGPSLTFAGCRKKVRSCGEEGGGLDSSIIEKVS